MRGFGVVQRVVSGNCGRGKRKGARDEDGLLDESGDEGREIDQPV